jgi:hypothetical protein
MADSACIDCLSPSPATWRGRLAASRRVAFWLLAFVFAAAMPGTTVPTPLCVIHQARWHFSPATVTVIFALYAAGHPPGPNSSNQRVDSASARS